jgi:hypothetical protein
MKHTVKRIHFVETLTKPTKYVGFLRGLAA